VIKSFFYSHYQSLIQIQIKFKIKQILCTERIDFSPKLGPY